MRDGVRPVVESTGIRAVELDEAVGVTHAGERPEDHRVDRGEHGGVQSDPEGERQYRDGGEAGLLEENANGVAEVGQRSGHTPPNWGQSRISSFERTSQAPSRVARVERWWTCEPAVRGR